MDFNETETYKLIDVIINLLFAIYTVVVGIAVVVVTRKTKWIED